MSTQYTAEMALPYWQLDDTDWHVQYQTTCEMVSASALGQLAVSPADPGATAPLPSTSLKVDVAAGSFRSSGGILVDYAGSTGNLLTSSSTIYLWLDDTGALTTGSAFPSSGTNFVRLAIVTTDASTVTAIEDARVFAMSFGDASSGTSYIDKAGDTITDGANFAFGTTTGSQLGTAADQKLGFYGATPVVQAVNTTDLKTVLVDLGFVASGGATPLDLGGGAVTAGAGSFSGDVTIADASNVVLGTTTGTQIGTASTQRLGFYGTTPIVQPAAASDLRTLLIDLGLLASGGANPLDTNGGNITCADLTATGTISFTGSVAASTLVFTPSFYTFSSGTYSVTLTAGGMYAGDCSSFNGTFVLPSTASSNPGLIVIRRKDATGGTNTLTIQAAAGETIEGSSAYTLNDGKTIWLAAKGVGLGDWWIVGGVF